MDKQLEVPLVLLIRDMPMDNGLILHDAKISNSTTLRVQFRAAAGQITHRSFKKSCAQVARLDAPEVSPRVSPNPVARLHLEEQTERVVRSYGLKLRPGEIDLIRHQAASHGLSVNAYIRAKALGNDYIVKPPPWLRDVLLQLYVELSRQGNNLNQLTRSVNSGHASAEAALTEAGRRRDEVVHVLRSLELALAGRRPPGDY